MEFRCLSFGPRVSTRGDRLIAETGHVVRFLSLGLIYRRVVVDPARSEVAIQRRYLWFFFRTERIRFAWIKAVTYGYENWSPTSWFNQVHDSLDHFRVGLRLHDGHDVRLFSFSGEGTLVNDSAFSDGWYFERLASDLSGTQERDSRGLVELLCRAIGVSVVPA